MMKRHAGLTSATLSLVKPVVHPYTRELQKLMTRHRMEIRGSDGFAAQSRVDPVRLTEIYNGSMPSMAEHKAMCRALPGMRHHTNMLAIWHAAVETEAKLSKPAEPTPARPPVSRPEDVFDGGRASTAAEMMSALAEMSAAEPPESELPIALPIVEEPSPMTLPTAPVLTITPRTFGEYLRACRERQKMRREEIAELIHVSHAAVWAWEEDTAIPVEENYAKLLALFPELADRPKPKVRDITKPLGRTGYKGSPDPLLGPEPPPGFVPRDTSIGFPEDASEGSAEAPVKAPPPPPVMPSLSQASTAQASPMQASPMQAPKPRNSQPDVMALIRYGSKLEAVRSAIPADKRAEVVALLKLGQEANLTVEQILESFGE
jgi:transcriptional regulator with XRE-family HTH domain